jgi:hypothetical protein
MPDESASKRARHIGRWIAAGALGVIPLYMLAIRPWHLRWGATDEEVHRAMPGDEICANPHLDSTRAVTVQATPEQIWPWIVQIGRGRAGWYSYDFIDNPGRRSAEEILPAFQQLKAGDRIPTGMGQGFLVVDVEPNRHLALQVGPQGSITFALYPDGPASTRLVTRVRVRWNLRNPKDAAAAVVVDPGDFIMMRKMMLGIKRRAEAQKITKR